MAERRGYRGYNASRPVRGVSTPQRVQNLVIRDYAARTGLTYLLSASEFAMPGSMMMLENILRELDRIEGIIAFSAFMLPADGAARAAIYRRVLAAGATFHAALENLAIRSQRDIAPFEDLVGASLLLEHVPLHGRYEKDGQAVIERDDPFAVALRAG